MCNLGLFNVLTELSGIINEWQYLGLALQVPNDKIKEIEANHQKDVKGCLKKVIEAWLEMGSSQVTWKTLCKALRTELVNCDNIAKQIEEKVLSFS